MAKTPLTVLVGGVSETVVCAVGNQGLCDQKRRLVGIDSLDSSVARERLDRGGTVTDLTKFTWHEKLWTCSSCGWEGRGADAAIETFDALFELNCWECDSRLAVIMYPTFDEIKEAAAAGVPEALEMLPSVQAAEVGRLKLSEARINLFDLPNVEGETLTFTLGVEGDRDRLSPEWLILFCKTQEIYREPSGFEGWRAILEIGKAIRHQYGTRAAWLDPGTVGQQLLGDDRNASNQIHNFLIESGLTPPVGIWSIPS